MCRHSGNQDLSPDSPRQARAAAVRTAIPEACRALNPPQWLLGGLLCETRDHRFFKDWGFRSFTSYLKSELSLSPRKAQMLMGLHRTFTVKLCVPCERLQTLAWSKAHLVRHVINAMNADEVLHDIERLSYSELLRKYHAGKRERPAKPRAAEVITLTDPNDWDSRRPEADDFCVSDEHWRQMGFAICHGECLLVVGPAGSGKSELCERAARAAGRPLEKFNCGAMTEPRTTLIGNVHFDSAKGTWFGESRFVRAVQTAGRIILLDEISRAGPDAFNILLPLLDGQGYLALDEREDGAVIRRAAGVTFMATANIGCEFTGAARRLDKALQERFGALLRMDYPPAAKEAGLLAARYAGLSPQTAGLLVTVANEQRQLAREREFADLISTRMLLAAARQVAGGIPLKEAVTCCLLNHFSDDGGDTSDRARLQKICQKQRLF